VAFHVQGGSKSGGESTDSGLSSKTEPPFEAESPMSKKASSSDHQAFDQQHLQHRQQLQQDMASDAARTASSQNQSAAKSQEKVSLIQGLFSFLSQNSFLKQSY